MKAFQAEQTQNGAMHQIMINKAENNKTYIIGSSKKDCDIMSSFLNSQDCKLFYKKEEKTWFLEKIDPNCRFYFKDFHFC